MIRGLLAVLALVLAWAGPLAARELPAVVLDGDASSLALDGHLDVLEDKDGRLGIADIAGGGAFHPAGPSKVTTGTFWYRFTVTRRAGAPAEWMLAFGEPDIDDVRLYHPDGLGGFTESRLGRRISNEMLPLAARRHVVALTLPEGQPRTLYLRLSTPHKLRFEDAALWRPAALLFAEVRETALYGLHFGALAVVALVYILFSIWLRDAAMALYAAYVATILGRGLTHTGMAALVFPAADATVNHVLSGIGLLGGLAAFVLMWDRVLDLRRTFPRVHRLYLAGGTAATLALPTALTPVFAFIAPAAHLIMLIASLGSLVLAARLAWRNPKDVLLRFYLFAFLPIVVAWAVQILARVVPQVPVDLGRQMDVGSTMAHIAILSVALAYRLGRMQREQMEAEVILAGERMARQRMRTFVDMATHEFKTPLAVIDSAAQVLGLLAQPKRPEITGRIATIRRSVQRLINLIEICLAGERAEAMAVRLRLASPHSLALEAAERNHAPDWPDLVVDIGDLPATCEMDPDLVGIALDALIDNARRYGGADNPVELRAREEGGAVVFVVADRGSGVPLDAVPRIFDKYYRAPSVGPTPGTGLGLYLVKTIAELHGGSVCYRRRERGGASFALMVPVTAPALP